MAGGKGCKMEGGRVCENTVDIRNWLRRGGPVLRNLLMCSTESVLMHMSTNSMYICMYVHMYVRMYVCMYVRIQGVYSRRCSSEKPAFCKCEKFSSTFLLVFSRWKERKILKKKREAYFVCGPTAASHGLMCIRITTNCINNWKLKNNTLQHNSQIMQKRRMIKSTTCVCVLAFRLNLQTSHWDRDTC